jgi:transcription antitermination factor NusG
MSHKLYNEDGFAWYALQVRAKSEQLASSLIEFKGYEQFLPMYREARRWSDRVKQVELPLFPGYFFCRLNLSERILPVLTTPGVLSIVGAGKTPVPISEEEVNAVRTLVCSGLAPEPWPLPITGSRVLIERGPLTGLEGIAVEVKDTCRLVVSVTLLQRAISVEIDGRWARPISNSPQPDRESPPSPKHLSKTFSMSTSNNCRAAMNPTRKRSISS